MNERFTDRARKVMELSLREALQFGDNYVAPEHILLALFREGESLAAVVLQEDLHLSSVDVRTAIVNRRNGYASEESKIRAFLREKGVDVRTPLSYDQLSGMATALGYAGGPD